PVPLQSLPAADSHMPPIANGAALNDPSAARTATQFATEVKVAPPHQPGIVERFTHPLLRLDADTLYRSRILIMALLLMLVVVALSCIVVATATLPLLAKIANLSITLSITATIIFLLRKLHRTGDYFYCSTATVLMLFTGNFFGICISGGIATAPNTALMAIPTLLAYFFSGVRWGTYVALTSLATLIILYAFEVGGLHFYNTSDISHAPFNQLLVNLMGLVVMCGMAFIYEFTTSALMRARDAEHEKVNRLAYTDALTGLANRLDFDTELALRIARFNATITRSSFALCLLDLDGFKPINDEFGHDVGDEVLQVVSERLLGCLREADYVGRQGGDEFMLIFDAVSTTEQVEVFAQRVAHMIELPIHTSAGSMQVTGSLGFALFPDSAADAEALKSAADRAMYAAKRSRSGWSVESN
ncbi:MAG TPA: GGDEF domain-containing protein, partial [Spongiibacteraceae bacterium]|nr:GGDEF domain-containing protein [Spongiibacteraceae bacterium]